MTPISTLLRASWMATLLFALVALPARAAQTINIDGHLNDAAWKKARPIEAFKTFAGKTPKAATTGLMLTDANTLYLAFRSEEPLMDKLEATAFPRDGKLWTNDCIEIYIAPFATEETYFQIIVDANGQVFDAFKRDGDLDINYTLNVRAKTQRQSHGWTMEAAIPLHELGLSKTREALMNFGRERKPVSENTAWHGIFHKPETWQKVSLSLDNRYDVEVRNWDFGALQYGENELALEFVPSTDAPVGVLLQAQENGKWMNKDRKVARSDSGKVTRFAMPYLLEPQHKPQSIRLVLERGGQPMFRTTRRLSLPANALVATLTVPYYYTDEDAVFVRFQNFISPSALKASHIRLTIKDPRGKIVSSSDIHNLRPIMLAGFDISSWRDGAGSLTAELLLDNKTLSSRTVVITKRPGPFSVGAAAR